MYDVMPVGHVTGINKGYLLAAYLVSFIVISHWLLSSAAVRDVTTFILI
jgi:hypothetical protein